MIEEHEWTDGTAAHMRQRAPHRKPVEIDRARHDHRFERVAGVAVSGRRVLAREKAHWGYLFVGGVGSWCVSCMSEAVDRKSNALRQAEFADRQCLISRGSSRECERRGSHLVVTASQGRSGGFDP